ncbi:AraC family transcriptional regulator [Microlunatus sp. Gsoil 973]|uniref:AraC family transcriptional regulator n=1 Tax=Microlunatus sp. Gsoil 973 TaxID=2672569 RepID=UPI0012B458C7|nr:AraC family transcriptional regulator [Microlunatus sp. Gsoil 973]QGN33122.1 helix-turn-helix domain-containing protein [Microlunatus sp. Gsoil 973]
MYLRDGFPGQRLHVLPGPLVQEALTRPPTSRLMITDAGYFPHAAMHGRVRRTGAGQTILIMCADGAGWGVLDGVRHEVAAGQLMLIPARTPHQYYAHTTDPWSIWWLHVTGADVDELVEAIGLTAIKPVAALSDPVAAFALVEAICDTLERDETWASLIAAAGLGWNLLARLAAERQRSGNTEPLRLVQDHLRQHLTAPVRIPELAELAGFSPSHFSARFRAFTGYSVIEYVKRLRMARARQLLITSDRTIAEIATAVGYRDAFYFSRVFRAVNQTSPSAFRARAREEAGHQATGKPTVIIGL